MTVAVSQPLQALALANEVRSARAALKRQVKAGTTAVADVLLAVPPEAMTMAVGDLIGVQPRWGRVRTLKLLAEVPIDKSRPVGAMTARQRRLLADLLDDATGPRAW